MTPRAVVVGAHVNGLGIIRSLARRHVPIAVVSTRSYDVAQHSRWVSECDEFFELHEEPDSLADYLAHQSNRWRGRAFSNGLSRCFLDQLAAARRQRYQD